MTTQTRLDRLLALRRQLDAEIAEEAERERRSTAKRDTAEAAKAARIAARLAARPPAAVVREWAHRYGHLNTRIGRIPDQVFDMYLDAHPERLTRRRT